MTKVVRQLREWDFHFHRKTFGSFLFGYYQRKRTLDLKPVSSRMYLPNFLVWCFSSLCGTRDETGSALLITTAGTSPSPALLACPIPNSDTIIPFLIGVGFDRGASSHFHSDSSRLRVRLGLGNIRSSPAGS